MSMKFEDIPLPALVVVVILLIAFVVGVGILVPAAILAFTWNIVVPHLFGPGAPTLDLPIAVAFWLLLSVLAAPFRSFGGSKD